jgi:hypothetical protein
MKLLCSLFIGLIATALSAVSSEAAWSLKGSVHCPGGQGYENVSIEITGKSCAGKFSFTATTDSLGNYAVGLPECNGTYKACIVPATLPPGSTVVSPVCVAFTTNSSNNDINVNWIVESSLCGSSGTCPHTQGYWKNHASAWPVTSIMLGSQTYTQAELLVIFRTPIGRGTSADASLILAHQLIAAKLNVSSGSNPGPISGTISAADALLGTFGGKLPYRVAPSSTAGQQMVNLAGTLDQYNNGQFTPNCDD